VAKLFDPRTDSKHSCLWCGDVIPVIYQDKFEINTAKPPRKCENYKNPFTKELCGGTKFAPITIGWHPVAEAQKQWICLGCNKTYTGRKIRNTHRKINAKPGPYGNGYFDTIECGFMFAVAAAKHGISFDKDPYTSGAILIASKKFFEGFPSEAIEGAKKDHL
jgi:hypothetical protein